MSLITAFNLGKSYGSNDIFKGISFSLPPRARIGLVGANGIGKTTMLRILGGQEELSSGSLQRKKGMTLGYLAQNARYESQRSLWEECLGAFDDLLARQKELARLETEMSDPQRASEALEVYGSLQEEFDRLGGYTFETRIRQTLSGLGFTAEDIRRPLEQLSGGQRTRAFLARLLLNNPDLLLLDEPTNHLDIAAIEWLENYLGEWPGAVLIVSHDRYFLDRVVDHVWEMTPALEVYRGNYSAYLKQRTERRARQMEEFQTQQEFITREAEYIRRNIAGQNTRQARGRLRRLERLVDDQLLEKPKDVHQMRFRLSAVGRSGDLVLRTFGLSIGYADGSRALFSVPDLILVRGECAAVIGPNGAGKTTFLKTLMEKIPPLEGEVTLGASLQIGYFAQAHEGLHEDWTLMQEIEGAAPRMLPGEMRDYLAKFLFTGDDVFKPVHVLSGGERGRLALACLALQGTNLLLLDEPTNHLDLPSQEILQAILADYGGTILLVSHDRYLIDALATQVWDVLPEEGRLRVFNGAYSEYRASLQAETAGAGPASPVEKAVTKPRLVAGPSKEQQRRQQQRVQKLEAEIHKLEEQMAQISRQLENPPPDAARVHRLGQEYVQLQQQLEAHMDDWTRAMSE